MAGFATLQAVIDALNQTGNSQMVPVLKQYSATTVANVVFTSWQQSGIPVAGTTPSVGLGSAATCSKSTSGAVQFNNAPSGKNTYLQSIQALRGDSGFSVWNAGWVLMVDRLAHFSVNHAQASGDINPDCDGTARLASGEGAMIVVEVKSNLSAGSNSFHVTYTNQAGTTGRNTESVATVASRTVHNLATGNLSGSVTGHIFLPLQAGDSGARVITDWVLDSGSATGQLTVALVRPLAWIPLGSFYTTHEFEYASQHQNLVEIPDNACLAFYSQSTTTTAAPFMANLTLIHG